MANFDEMKVEILPDGTIKSTTDEVSAANHDDAEQFLTAMAHLAGGKTTRKDREDVNHAHVHHHGDHVHSHGGGTKHEH